MDVDKKNTIFLSRFDFLVCFGGEKKSNKIPFIRVHDHNNESDTKYDSVWFIYNLVAT